MTRVRCVSRFVHFAERNFHSEFVQGEADSIRMKRSVARPLPATFEYRCETGEMFTFDGRLAAVPHEDSYVSWHDGHGALQVQSVIICADTVIVRVKGLMRTGSVPTYLAGGWRK